MRALCRKLDYEETGYSEIMRKLCKKLDYDGVQGHAPSVMELWLRFLG